MKITFILPVAGFSGAIRVAVCRANGLLKRGHQVRILCRRRKRGFKKLVNVTLLRLTRGKAADWLWLSEAKVSGFDNLADCRFVDGEVLVALGSSCACEAARLQGPFGARVHDMHGALPGFDPHLDEALRLDMPKIVVATYLAEMVREVSEAEVLGVVPGGVDESEYFPPETDRDRLGVGSIYAKAPFKGPDVLVAALDRLAEDMPAVPQHVFGGGLKWKARDLRHAEYVKLPTVEQARRIYGKCKVWLITSTHEGFPAPILEAMACGCAVISTDCGGPRDIITDGENGFLVPVDDVDAIVRLAERLLTDDDLRRRVAGKAIETAREYTWERSIDRLEECLERAVSRQKNAAVQVEEA